MNWASWFEIPVSDFSRAKSFYESIFGIELHVMDLQEIKMGIFPHAQGGGAICEHPSYIPNDNGTLLYLNAGDQMQEILDRIKANGGSILCPKTQISPENGYMALFLDSEGNRLALHSES